jgi:hypothetical protein
MTYDNILSIVAAAGNIDISILNKSRDYLMPKLLEAAAGTPITIPTGARSIGRCYYQYEEVVVNYTGAEAEKPNGMSGKVPPTRIGCTDGVNWAYFTYDIDSGG